MDMWQKGDCWFFFFLVGFGFWIFFVCFWFFCSLFLGFLKIFQIGLEGPRKMTCFVLELLDGFLHMEERGNSQDV